MEDGKKSQGLPESTEQVRVSLARPQCPNSSLCPTAPTPHCLVSGELGPAGPFKAGWVRLLSLRIQQ